MRSCHLLMEASQSWLDHQGFFCISGLGCTHGSLLGGIENDSDSSAGSHTEIPGSPLSVAVKTGELSGIQGSKITCLFHLCCQSVSSHWHCPDPLLLRSHFAPTPSSIHYFLFNPLEIWVIPAKEPGPGRSGHDHDIILSISYYSL